MARALDAAMAALKVAGAELTTLRSNLAGARDALISQAQECERQYRAYEDEHEDDHDYLRGKAEAYWEAAKALS